MPVTLRPLSAADTPRVHELISNPRVVEYMLIPLATDMRQTAEFVEACVNESNHYLTQAITIKGEDRLVGLCGIAIQKDYDAGEIWYLLDPACWGRGLMSEAVDELLRVAFGELSLHRVWATCCPENTSSFRVLEKAGMRREGHHRKNLPIQGRWHDSYLYAILAEEWHARLGARARGV